MPYPKVLSIEIPVLNELAASGGSEHVKFLYERLIAYFPQITIVETSDVKNNKAKSWKTSVQKAGKLLEENNFIRRSAGHWNITEKGLSRVKDEIENFSATETENVSLTHSVVQQMLLGIGKSLGFYAQAEFEYYDVVWRENVKNPRISHVFEVQSKGNIDSAFAKLKRAYEAQRTKPFLIISSEKDLRRAQQSLVREFQDIDDKVTILTFAQIQQTYRNLDGIAEIIKQFLVR